MHVSSVPLLLDCPSSQLPCDQPYDKPSDAGEVGSATHDGLAEHVQGREADTGTLAKAYGVQAREVGPLLAYGRMAWDEVKDDMPNPLAEVKMAHSTIALNGRADVISISDDGDLAVLDWKTNRERKDVRGQLKGYASCMADLYGIGPSGVIRTYTVWLRLGEIDVDEITAEELDRFGDQLVRARRNIGRQYSPGEACTFCPRQLVCEARRDYVRTAVAALTPMAAGMVVVNPDALPTLYRQAQLLGKALEQYKDALKMIIRADGPQPDGQGGTLELVTRGRDEIDAREAWPILVDEGFSEGDLAGCMNVASGALFDVVAAKAPKGKKGKEKGRVKQRLRDAGAIERREYQQLTLKKGTTP